MAMTVPAPCAFTERIRGRLASRRYPDGAYPPIQRPFRKPKKPETAETTTRNAAPTRPSANVLEELDEDENHHEDDESRGHPSIGCPPWQHTAETTFERLQPEL